MSSTYLINSWRVRAGSKSKGMSSSQGNTLYKENTKFQQKKLQSCCSIHPSILKARATLEQWGSRFWDIEDNSHVHVPVVLSQQVFLLPPPLLHPWPLEGGQVTKETGEGRHSQVLKVDIFCNKQFLERSKVAFFKVWNYFTYQQYFSHVL